MTRRLLLVLCATLFAAGLVAPASAQDLGAPLDVRIREISFDDDNRTRIVASVAGPAVADLTLGAGDFTVTENGTAVQGLEVQPFFSGTRAAAIALVMDVSGSTTGAPLAAAKAEATNFVRLLPENVRVSLVSFGADVLVPVEFTTDKTAVIRGIEGLRSGGRTRLFDAVVLATQRLVRQGDAQRTMVIFSDGNDTESTASLSEASSSLQTGGTPALGVLLSTERTVGADELRTLAEAQEGGQFIQAADQAQLGAAFARVAQSIASQYVVSYGSDDRTTAQLDISLSARAGGFVASDQSTVLNGRERAAPPPLEIAESEPLVPFFANEVGLYVGIAAAFLGVAFFVGMVLWAPAEKSNERALARRLRMYTRGGPREKASSGTSEAATFFASSLGQRAISMVEKVPRWNKLEQSLQQELARAGWPLRSSEFVLIQVGAAAAGLLIGAGLFGRFWLGLVLMAFGAVIPRVVLVTKISKRTAAFLEQLPETLQLLSGSLQAGYGFVQALDTVAKESPTPTSSEFSRVLTEARLGMPLEDALDEMADRVGGEDFRWVVLAINIQRQVGGNLASLLTTVSNTLRERERVRRQIKVLSAEGRLSAIILTALPFVLFGYLSLVNPGYIAELTTTTIGKIMMVGSLILIAIGALWMRKMIKIDV